MSSSPALSRPIVATLFFASALVTFPARAFERQWHFGAGLGAASASGAYDTGIALGAHAAYGLSDVFDLRLELQSSKNDVGELPVWFHGGRFGIAYKLDVIQWIPYGGVSGGGFVVAWDGGTLLRPSAGAFVGLDYAASRHLGLGVIGAGDYVFVDSGVTLVTVLVRGEYRFGW
ncbi:MAG TPA: hypothetical protein VFZ53_17195 [Polyangiaceae bacterium]